MVQTGDRAFGITQVKSIINVHFENPFKISIRIDAVTSISTGVIPNSGIRNRVSICTRTRICIGMNIISKPGPFGARSVPGRAPVGVYGQHPKEKHSPEGFRAYHHLWRASFQTTCDSPR